jgi:RNA polymerase sigma-70 factor (ECF subfamily)
MKEQDFTVIVNETKNVVLKAIGENLANEYYHAIDDVVQETYLRAYKSLSQNKFKGDSLVSTWLYTIARNESLRMNGKLNREKEKAKKSQEAFILEQAKNNTEKESEEDKSKLYNLISKLPEKYRSVMELVVQGRPIKNISQELNIKSGTVKSRTKRGRDLLQTFALQEERWKI